jgi:hypothetical protein
MHQEYTAVIKKDAGWWIGWIEEVPGAAAHLLSVQPSAGAAG